MFTPEILENRWNKSIPLGLEISIETAYCRFSLSKTYIIKHKLLDDGSNCESQ